MSMVPIGAGDGMGAALSSAQQFAELMSNNDLLAKENKLLDSWLYRHAAPDETFERPAPKAGRRRHHQVHDDTCSQTQRSSIASEEETFRTKELKEFEAKAEEDTGLLKAITEGIKIRINEMRKETYEFKRDIVIGAENTRTGTINAERCVKYLEDKIKQKTLLVEKIRLKNMALKQARAKMDAQIKHKEEVGDSLHSIDFHQLQIKNNQFNQKMDERNAELLKLKLTTGKIVQVLNTAKRNLNDLLTESKHLNKDLKDRKAATIKLTAELEKVDAEVAKEKKRNKKLTIQQSNPDMPQVLDYVNQKSAMYDMEAAVRNWERKNEIVAMGAKRAKRLLRSLGINEDPNEPIPNIGPNGVEYTQQ